MLNEHFPQVKTLSLAQNELESLESSGPSPVLYLPTIETLILDRNSLGDLSSLVFISQSFPYLRDLSLQQNHIDRIGELNAVDVAKVGMFHNLRSLNISSNQIADFAFVDQLSFIFPNLTFLRISNNPLYQKQPVGSSTPSATRSDIPYSFTLARIPSLTVLNYTTITPRDREEGEIYYLSAAGKEISALLEASTNQEGDLSSKIEVARRKHPRYEALCVKYDRDSIFERYTPGFIDETSVKPVQKFAPGSLAARLLEATFYVPTFAEKFLHRSIARTIDVYRVKALISREMGLRPLQFRLVYESEELDPVRDGLEQKSSDCETWGDWDVDGESDADSQISHDQTPHETWTDGVLLKDGKKWKKREVEILDGTKAWGDYIGDDEVRIVTIRVEPFDEL